MIKHIVMFRLKDTDGRTAMENAVTAKEMADKLPSLVPSIKSMEVRINSEAADNTNYHIALICDFEDMNALDEYQNHPEHKKFGAFIVSVRAEGGRACIDYEY
ncbi:MAG: Dabb family protein [Oscillospiraceae bacterium]|nr:Dabb family protein [Oscillospiraceae bacterium]